MGEGPETLRIDHGEEKTLDDSAGKTAENANKSGSPGQVKDDEDSMNKNFFIKPSANTSKPIMRLDVIQQSTNPMLKKLKASPRPSMVEQWIMQGYAQAFSNLQLNQMCNQVQEKPKEENETEKKAKEDVKDLKLEMEFDDEPAASTS